MGRGLSLKISPLALDHWISNLAACLEPHGEFSKLLRPNQIGLTKPARWLTCTLPFKNHWSSEVALELFYGTELSSKSARASIPSKPESMKVTPKEEPGGLQSTGSWRVGHDWATSLSPRFTSIMIAYYVPYAWSKHCISIYLPI